MNKNLPTCCQDMDVNPLDIMFPERFDAAGMEFVEAHGLLGLSLDDIFLGCVPLEDGKVKIFHRCNHLQDNGLCDIYDKRPKICREFNCALRKDCTCNGTGKCPISAS